MARLSLSCLRHATRIACPYIHSRSFHVSMACLKNVRTGIPKITSDRSKKLTYEQAQKPNNIGVTKTWNSLNTSGLHIEDKDLEKWLPRSSETATEDVWIRKFITGTWQDLLASDTIIKRKGNQISLAFLISRQGNPRQVYFLKGYSEELLSHVLKCVIRVEVQSVEDPRDKLVFKKI